MFRDECLDYFHTSLIIKIVEMVAQLGESSTFSNIYPTCDGTSSYVKRLRRSAKLTLKP